MAIVDDPNSQNSQQIAGEAPLSSGTDSSPMAESQTTDNVVSTAPTIQSQASTSPSGPQTNTTNRKAPKASSGMFTNIQKYVEKNRPQAQKMAGAVTQDVGKQAEQIRQAAAEKQAQQQQTIQANQNLMDQNRKQAEQQVQNIMSPIGLQSQAPETSQVRTSGSVQGTQLPEVQQPTQEQTKSFQELMSGNIQGLQQVQDLNLAQQQNRASVLAQLAQGAGTEQGRRNLLGETFRKQGDYTRGMSGLDQLITSGDQAAREALVTGVQGQSKNLQDQLQNIGSEANIAKQAQDMAIKNFGTDIENLGVEAQAEIMRQVNAEVENQRNLLTEQIGNLQTAASDKFLEGLKYNTTEDFYRELANQFTPEWSKAGNRSFQDRASIENLLLGGSAESLATQLLDRGVGGFIRDREDGYGNYRDFSDEEIEKLGQNITLGSEGSQILESAFEGLLQNASDYGIDVDKYRKSLQDLGQAGNRYSTYGWSGHQDDSGSNINTYNVDEFKDVTERLFSDIESARENALQAEIANKYGLGQEEAAKFLSGEGIDVQGVASQSQVDKMAALRQLLGGETDSLGTELGSDFGEDMDLLSKIRKSYGIS